MCAKHGFSPVDLDLSKELTRLEDLVEKRTELFDLVSRILSDQEIEELKPVNLKVRIC